MILEIKSLVFFDRFAGIVLSTLLPLAFPLAHFVLGADFIVCS